MQIKDLKPAGYNPRKITDEKLAMLKKSLEEFGDLSGVVYNRRTDTLIGGHQRIKALDPSWPITIEAHTDKTGTVAAGYIETPHGRLTYRQVDWPESKEKAANIAANKHGGEFDDDLLRALVDELRLSDTDMDLIGFDSDEISELMASGEPEEPRDAEPQIDRAEELNQIWGVKPGDLWQIGEHRLLCGDSTKKEDVGRVMGGEKADMVFTDPPYGIEVVQNKQIGGEGAFGGKKNERKGKAVISANAYAEVVGDETTETAQKFYTLCVELGFSNMILWGGNYFTDFLPPSRGWVCWDKIDGVEGTTKNFSDIELAWTSFNVPARIVRHRWQGLLKASEHNEKRCHPTQKPAALAAECFELYKAGDIVFDGFLGSGSTMVACQNLNRKCRGIEISPDYCAVILQRMADAFPGIEIKRIN